MKIPMGNMGQIIDMIQSMMPYDFDHVAQSDEAIAIQSIFESLTHRKPDLKTWQGFMGYLVKDIDVKPESRESVKNLLEDMGGILEQYNDLK